eukprot:3936157-Rhodomonas_salina.1
MRGADACHVLQTQAPPNGSVTTESWSAAREYFYEDPGFTVECGADFMASDSSGFTCRKAWEVTCNAEGQFEPLLNCTLLRCDVRSIRAVTLSADSNVSSAPSLVRSGTTLAVLPPKYRVYSDLGPFNSSGTLADPLEVTLGERVSVVCAPDYARSHAGATEVTCSADCQFEPAVIACTIFNGTCEALDKFELSPGVEESSYFGQLDLLTALEEVPVGCKAGYRLDNSDGSVVIAGAYAYLLCLPYEAPSTITAPSTA